MYAPTKNAPNARNANETPPSPQRPTMTLEKRAKYLARQRDVDIAEVILQEAARTAWGIHFVRLCRMAMALSHGIPYVPPVTVSDDSWRDRPPYPTGRR